MGISRNLQKNIILINRDLHRKTKLRIYNYDFIEKNILTLIN
jgi:hypothetical protein